MDANLKRKLTVMALEYGKKYHEADRNYQETGKDRYWNLREKYNSLYQSVNGLLEGDKYITKGMQYERLIHGWARKIEGLYYLPKDKKDAVINDLLQEIKNCGVEV